MQRAMVHVAFLAPPLLDTPSHKAVDVRLIISYIEYNLRKTSIFNFNKLAAKSDFSFVSLIPNMTFVILSVSKEFESILKLFRNQNSLATFLLKTKLNLPFYQCSPNHMAQLAIGSGLFREKREMAPKMQ